MIERCQCGMSAIINNAKLDPLHKNEKPDSTAGFFKRLGPLALGLHHVDDVGNPLC